MSEKIVLREITYEQMSTLVTELKTNNFVKDKEIERLHSIIKEVREYIKSIDNYFLSDSCMKLLEILDDEKV